MNKFIDKIIHVVLLILTQIFFWRVREIKVNEKPYLKRLYLFKRNGLFFKFPFAIYLHYFHNGDEADCLHNHPWGLSKSLILSGGYTEYRKKYCVDPSDGVLKPTVVTNILKRGCLNKIDRNDFHRIILRPEYYGKHTWTLFISGNRVFDYDDRNNDWGFWDPVTNTYTPHNLFER